MATRLQREAKRLAPCLFALVLGLALSLDVPVRAANAESERARLAAMLRQLDVLDRLAQDSADATAPDGARYHFDYARLHADIDRIRKGITQYLSPPRAQPRDPQTLNGEYVVEGASP